MRAASTTGKVTYPPVATTQSGRKRDTTPSACATPIPLSQSVRSASSEAVLVNGWLVTNAIGSFAFGTMLLSSPARVPTNSRSVAGSRSRSASAIAIAG